VAPQIYWKDMENQWKTNGKSMENQWKINGTSWKINGTSWTIENHGKLWKVIGGYLFSDGQIL
jgi:hypothetical protein